MSVGDYNTSMPNRIGPGGCNVDGVIAKYTTIKLPSGQVVATAVTVPGLTLRQVQDNAAAAAREKGWDDRPIEFPEMAALIHSEVSEALESYRNGEKILWFGPDGKPEGISSELADVIIRIAHYATLLGFDLQQAVADKMAFNKTRPYRHGGKRI